MYTPAGANETSPYSTMTSSSSVQQQQQHRGVNGGSYPQYPYDDFDYRLGGSRPGSASTAAGKIGPPTAPKPVLNHRLTRKMSTDSLLAYRTYQSDGEDRASRPSAAELLGIARPTSGGSRGGAGGVLLGRNGGSGAGGGGGGSTYSTMTLSRAQQLVGRGGAQRSTSVSPSSQLYQQPQGGGPQSSSSSTTAPSPAAVKLQRNLQLARKPLQIQTELYRPCRSVGLAPLTNGAAGTEAGAGVAVEGGILVVRVLCAHGLRSSGSRTTLRDLYCVVELDTASRARTTIRTGAINFDWDETFEIDSPLGARRLAFLVYSWDPSVRHRLCFGGAVTLPSVVESPSAQPSSVNRLAVSLEPKGVLYVEVELKPMSAVLQRVAAAPAVGVGGKPGGVFGVALAEIVSRERSASTPGSVIGVPGIVQRCVEEVERRGLEHAGIYRLCGSARRKQQLRDEIETTTTATTVDLSADSVSDINVITCMCI